MRKEIKSLTFAPNYKLLLLEALMRTETGSTEEFEEHARTAHKIAVEALQFITIANPTMNASVMVLLANAFTANMVLNIFPEVEKEMTENGFDPAGMLLVLQAICELTITMLISQEERFVIDKEGGTLDPDYVFDEMKNKVKELYHLLNNVEQP
jgi:hypothetical protein